jgi:hypothetical protein
MSEQIGYQLVKSKRDSVNHVRESVHKQAVVLCDGIQCVARRNGLTYNEVLDFVVEQERINAQRRVSKAWRDGKMSNWKVAA